MNFAQLSRRTLFCAVVLDLSILLVSLWYYSENGLGISTYLGSISKYLNYQNKVKGGVQTMRSISTSVAGMEQLLSLEKLLFVSLEKYADELQQKVDTIRSGVASYRYEHEKAHLNIEEYLSNPLHSFALIRRMHSDWDSWLVYAAKPVGKGAIPGASIHTADNNSELAEAIESMHRLQTTYDLEPDDMMAGRLQGKQYNVTLSSLDAYSIGVELYQRKNYFDASFWLYTGIHVHQDTDLYAALDFNMLSLLEIYAEVMIEQNRHLEGLRVIKMALNMDKDNERFLRRREEIEMILRSNVTIVPTKYPPIIPTSYQRGCRGQYNGLTTKLHCRYNSTVSAFSKLAPFKTEEIQLDPYMVLYHDVLYDSEIAFVKSLAQPNLKRSTVLSPNGKSRQFTKGRTSKSFFVKNDIDNVTLRINQRIADMTGFNLNGSENIQVLNYGLGGHYDVHADYFELPKTHKVMREQGNRIATVLFYMSDVEQGGATVFPHIRTAVFPRKGMAVLWYNLNNRGDGDVNTEHAACPVLVGSKWVFNKWIRERNQLFTRPCFN